MTMDRRQLLKTAGAVACVAAVPKALNAVRCIQGDGCVTCEQYGMAGTWPNCYYPQYLNLNQQLANETFAAMKWVIGALGVRNLVQANWGNLNNLTSQLIDHLSVSHTYINECLRLQFVKAYPGTNVTQSWVTYAQNWASQNGLSASLYNTMLTTAQPNMAQSSAQATDGLQQQILKLTDYQGLDGLSDWVYAETANVTIQNGICGIPTSDADNWVVRGSEIATAGVGLGMAAPLTGPAAPFVEMVGETLAAYGGIMGLAGLICRIE